MCVFKERRPGRVPLGTGEGSVQGQVTWGWRFQIIRSWKHSHVKKNKIQANNRLKIGSMSLI